MLFLADIPEIASAEFRRGKDKKPRKKRGIGKILSAAGQGAATGVGVGWGTGFAISPKRLRVQQAATIGGAGIGALASGINQYRNQRKT